MLRASLRAKNKMVYDLPERLNQKWDALNIKRLMDVLLSMKRFDPELLQIRTKPERDRLAYEEEKRKAVFNHFQKANREVAELRTRLLPEWNIDERKERLNTIRKNVTKLMNSGDPSFNYDVVERQANEEV